MESETKRLEQTQVDSWEPSFEGMSTRSARTPEHDADHVEVGEVARMQEPTLSDGKANPLNSRLAARHSTAGRNARAADEPVE